MSPIIVSLAQLFSNDFSINKIVEKSDSVTIDIDCNDLKKPTVISLNQIIDQFCQRDTLSIEFHQDNSFIVNVSSNSLDNFDSDLQTASTYINNAPYLLKFVIEKKIIDQTISVYNFDEFITNLSSLDINNLLQTFNKLFKSENRLIFEIQDSNFSAFTTKTIVFKGLDDTTDESKLLNYNRQEVLDKAKQTSFSNLISTYSFTPDDFNILDNNIKYENIKLLFSKITFLYSISFLFDITNFESENIFSYKLNGYKTFFKDNVQISDLDLESFKEYYQIYSWVYDSGNIVDKIGLARNILSLNFSPDNLSLSSDVIKAILSSFKIYQKENIKQYIELRNRISSQLNDILNKADYIVEKFVNEFKTTLFTILSFYVTVIIINTISTGNIFNGFNLQILIISIALILISLFIMLTSVWEIKQQIIRFTNQYNNLNNKYTDLLDTIDIKRILNNDKDFNECITYINKRKYVFSGLWIISIAILLFLSILLYILNFPTYTDILFSLIKIILCCTLSI